MPNNEKHVTWGGRFSAQPNALMQVFGESVSFDKRLASYDLQGSLGHAAMLSHVGLLTDKEFSEIKTGIEELQEEILKDDFPWKLELEDVHMNLEQALREKTEAADKLHTGRSRNDQVAIDMRLFFKDACSNLQISLEGTMQSLLTIAEKNASLAIPGYTHLQRAQPVTVGHHMLAYIEALGRDHERFSVVAKHANSCPLGSGAIAGSTLPLDREYTAKILGFVDENGNPCLTANGMDAVADRDLFLEFASACSITALHLSRLSEDLILWNSSEFGFVSLPDAFTTGSSLMPQKKNPDCYELVRGKTGRIVSNLTNLLIAVKGLPLTYNRDLQEDKPPVFDSFDQLSVCLAVVKGCMEGTLFNEEKCESAASDPLLLATDLADYLVIKGLPFRQAHHVVGELVGLAESKGVSLTAISDEEASGVSEFLTGEWREVFDLKRAFSMREKPGMPGPNQIATRIAHWKSVLSGI
ncbi:MAG: argininosuccinate lyase [Verrucomicrobiota bacterium]|nr:argininosuccinate lyase [Verrucomicrobiota bacterium]MEC8244135.1 argininosuccinate lyase [Verrucomicrobiota bacterium]